MTDNYDLAELFNKYGSDKDRNGYSSLYFTIFDKIKNDNINLLEIGIGTMIQGAPSSMFHYSLPGYSPGGSLRAWRDFFINGHIVGADIQPDTQFTDDRISTVLCNSIVKTEVDSLMNECFPNYMFDIIIDDGCHNANSQIHTLKNFFPYLKDGGIYVIEDIYTGSSVSSNPAIVKDIVGKSPFFYSGVKNNLCVIYKKTLNTNTQNF
jgi:hypothetical protein